MKGKKRNVLLFISSSDSEEDKDFKIKRKKLTSKSASVPRANPQNKRCKRTSLTNSSNLSREESHCADFDQIRRFCEEFDDGIAKFNGSVGTRRIKDLWVNKYKPHSLGELAVHKKKVEELKTLIEERLMASDVKGKCRTHVILITGPAGVGKSAAVHAISFSLGASVYEWNMPTPTLWQEYLHNSNSGLRYTSKLDEFEDFVERIRKYGLISSSAIEGSQTPVILLIDDLPVVNGKPAYRRLHRCLHLLVHSVCVPTVISITDYGNADSSEYTMHYLEELQLSLQDAGVHKVTFNLVTVNSMKKMLSKICREEHCEASAEQIELIAKISRGDIRNAITSLQYFCLKPRQESSIFSNGIPSGLREGTYGVSDLHDCPSLSFGRDESVSLFHALGKFLHNKRDTENLVMSDRDAMPLKEELVRLPLKIEAPEVVLRQAHGQSRPIADFLHENVLDFIGEEAIDDAWVVASYLSDADVLLASLSGKLARNFEAENAVQSAAASVAVRGVLFGNSHPGPSRWHTIRPPKLWHVEQALRQKKLQMTNQRGDNLNLYDLSTMVTEFSPALKLIGHRSPTQEIGYYTQSATQSATDMVEDELDALILAEENEVETEDEIEDW